MDASQAGPPVPLRAAGDDGAPAPSRPPATPPITGPDRLRRRLAEVAAHVEPLAERWTVERGRPRTRTLRRLMQTVELLLRLDEEVLLPAVGHGVTPVGGADDLIAGIEGLRDTLGLLMRGATGRRDAPMAALRQRQAAHRSAVDAWLAASADRLAPATWDTLADQVDDRVAPWLGALRADLATTPVRPPPPPDAPGSGRSSPAARGPAGSPDASPGDGSPA